MQGESDLHENVDTAQANRFSCGQCGARLVYEPGTTHLECGYCGFENTIEQSSVAAVEELDYRAYLAKLETDEEIHPVTTVKCNACGSETQRPPNLDAFACAFCGTDLVTTQTDARIIAPGALLPFHVDSRQAHVAFRAWIGKLWFAPSDLKRFSRSDGRVSGVYIPFWTYDSVVVSDYTGQRGEYYWVTETYTTRVNGKTVTRTRQVRKTRWYPASGRVRNDFDDLLVLSSRSLPVEKTNKLEPWDLDNLVPYQDEYLAGFQAEKYQVDLPSGFEIARLMMEEPIRVTIRRDIGGDVQQISSVDSRYHDITFKHLLLPVWLTAYRFRGKAYRIVINARTGEVQGDRPYSAWKIAFAILGGLAIIAVIVLIIMLSSGG